MLDTSLKGHVQVGVKESLSPVAGLAVARELKKQAGIKLGIPAACKLFKGPWCCEPDIRENILSGPMTGLLCIIY